MVKCNIEKNSILNMKINVKFNLNHEKLTFKILTFWLKNGSTFFLFIHKVDYRTLFLVRISLKKSVKNTYISFQKIFHFLILNL